MQTKVLSDFQGETIIERLALASRFLCGCPGARLVIEPGDYIISTPFAKKLMEDTLGGVYTQNPESVIFTPYFPYDSAFTLIGARDVKICAHGARFLLDGFMQAVEFRGCENVEIAGLTVDLLRKPYTPGRVAAVSHRYIDIAFAQEADITACTPSPRIVCVDSASGKFSKDVMTSFVKEAAGPGVIRYYAEGGALAARVNDEAVVIHTYHYRPSIFLHSSKNITLNDITIHAHCGMGVLAYRCDIAAVDGLTIAPSPGELISTNTDATHFACCKGLVSVKNSFFSGSEDDAINIHSYFYTPARIENNNCELHVHAPTFTHAQEIDCPDAGAKLALVDKRTLERLDEFMVVQAEICIDKLCAAVTLDRPLPHDAADSCLLFDLTNRAELLFENNRVEANLARGALIKAKSAIIRNCTFKNITGTAIHIAPETPWCEGGWCDSALIQNNTFENTGFGVYNKHQGAAAVCAETVCENPCAVVHGDIELSGNRFFCAGKAVYISCAKTVVLIENLPAITSP